MNTELNINELLAALKAAREEREIAAAALKEKDDVVDGVEQALMAAMNKAGGLSQVKGSGLTVSVISSTVAQVKDWQAFEQYVHRHQAYHLFERRVHTRAWREETETLGQPVPGTEPYERKRLHILTG